MKKIISLMLTIALIISGLTLPTSAQSSESFTVSVDTVNAIQGQNNIVVPIRLSGNPGISGFSICVDYDKDKLMLVKAEIVIDYGYKVIKETSMDGVNIAWTGETNYSKNDMVAKLYFNVPANVVIGKADIKIKYRDGYDSFYQSVNGVENDLAVLSNNGSVNILEAESNENLSVKVGNLNVTPNNSDIVVPISIENNIGFSGFSFCVNYDTTRLQLEKTEIVLNDGYKVISSPSGYGVNIAWTSEKEFADDGVIANLHFSLKENAVSGKGYISIVFRDGYDSVYKVSDGIEKDIECNIVNGYIDVSDHIYGEWVIIKEASCTETGLKRRTCTDLNCEKMEEVIIPKTAHEYKETIIPATCKEKGYTKHVCKNCSETFIDNYTDVLSHTLGEWEQSIAPDCTNSGEEVRKCTMCHEIVERRELVALGHSYGEWTIFKAPTFNEDGESRAYCKNCGDYKTERIPKLKESHIHDFSGNEEVITPASCTKEGNKKIYCTESECGEYIMEVIPKTAHDFGEWMVTKEPSFNIDGEKTRQCKNCTEVQTERIPKLSEGHVHDFSGKEEIVKSATCTEKGEKKIYCTNVECGEYEIVSIDMLEHVEGDWEIIESAKCNQTGTKVKKCTECGKVIKTETIAMIEHKFVDSITPPSPTAQGYTTHTCSECGFSYKDNYTDYEEPHVHDFNGKEEIVEEASCNKEGKKKVYCTGENCNEYTIIILPKVAHIESDWEVIEPATCSKCGTEAKKCINCGKVMETKDIEMIPHTFVDTITLPTPTTQGYTTHKCSECGYQYVDSYTDYVDDNPMKIVVENKSAIVGNTFTVKVWVKNNKGFDYLELTPVFSSELELVNVENGDLVDNFSKSNMYYWIADRDIDQDGILLTFTFKTSANVKPGDYEVDFICRSCLNSDNQDISVLVEKAKVEILDFTYGDANGDGVINGKDIEIIKKYLANYDYSTGKSTIELALGADANGDGVVDGKDVIRLKKYMENYNYETNTSTIILGPKERGGY